MTLNFLMFVSLLEVALASYTACNPVQDEAQRLTEMVNELESSFPGIIKDIYWDNRKLGQKLIKNGKLSEGNELINMAQVAASIEVFKYAIQMKSISSVGNMITSRFVKQDDVVFDNKLSITMRPEILPALVSRVLLRGLADSDRHIRYNWQWLHKLIEHNLPIQSEPAFKSLSVNAYQKLIKLELDLKKANENFEADIKNALKAMGIEEKHKVPIVAVLDRMIDEALNCTECSSAPVDEKRFNTRPIFVGDAVMEAVDELVDDELFASFADLPGVFTVTLEEQAKVSKDKIDELMQKTIH